MAAMDTDDNREGRANESRRLLPILEVVSCGERRSAIYAGDSKGEKNRENAKRICEPGLARMGAG